jgi:hypothetical protein
MENKEKILWRSLCSVTFGNVFLKKLEEVRMKTARTIIAVAMALFLQTALTPYVFAQMGGGMGRGYSGGQGMGGGMMGGQGYRPGYGRGQGYGPAPDTD